MSSTGKQIITISILPNISRSKGNQIMKFSQLIEYNMLNTPLKKSQTKGGRETSLKPQTLLKNQIEHISGLTV